MVHSDICQLPFELLLKIMFYLDFADIWYFGTCSLQTRVLAYRIIRIKYDIELLRPPIINPFGRLIHAAVAFLGRYGFQYDQLQQQVIVDTSIIQSVANHMAVAIYDRIPSKTYREFSLDFLLDKTLEILIDHALFDPTLILPKKLCEMDNFISKSEELMNQHTDIISNVTVSSQSMIQAHDIYALKSTGVLMADYLATMYPILTTLFDAGTAGDIHHRLLTNHIQRQLVQLKKKYHAYHSSQISHLPIPSSASIHQTPPYHDFQLFIQFLCALIRTELLTPKDIDHLSYHYINTFFITQPSDIALSMNKGLHMVMSKNHHSPVETSTDKLHISDYQWKLWLMEIQCRFTALLDLMKSIIIQYDRRSNPNEMANTIRILNDTASAISLSQSFNTRE
ncbi:hypothetical protein BDB01DRAFT_368540 [Pilobolus umbonatus]|nr:hypothetical protein BDB01DRAFT_368540 [Pilobolus umbonatus]